MKKKKTEIAKKIIDYQTTGQDLVRRGTLKSDVVKQIVMDAIQALLRQEGLMKDEVTQVCFNCLAVMEADNNHCKNCNPVEHVMNNCKNTAILLKKAEEFFKQKNKKA